MAFAIAHGEPGVACPGIVDILGFLDVGCTEVGPAFAALSAKHERIELGYRGIREQRIVQLRRTVFGLERKRKACLKVASGDRQPLPKYSSGIDLKARAAVGQYQFGRRRPFPLDAALFGKRVDAIRGTKRSSGSMTRDNVGMLRKSLMISLL